MELIKNRLIGLKKVIQEKRKENELLKEVLNKVLGVIFQNQKVLRHIKTFCVKNNTLFIETTNKTFAQELSFKKTEITQKIKENKISLREIVIR